MRFRAPAPLLAAFVAALAGCAQQTIDLFEPDWRHVLERSSADDETVSNVPHPEQAAPPHLPEITPDAPIELSVEQAVFLALRRNRELAVQELSPVVAGAFELIERGLFDPELYGFWQFQREEATETARATGEQFSVEGDDSALGAGVRQLLPSGTSIDAGVTQDRSISNRAPEQQTARLGLTVTQSLLQGFGPAVNLVSVQQAELETLASRYQLRAFIESLLAETEIAYWDYVLASERIAIFERSLEFARQQSDQVRQRIDVGVLPEAESAAPLAEIALREQALIEARSEREAAALRLLRLVNALPSPAALPEIVPTTEPVIEPEPITDIEPRLAVARKMRPEVNESRLRLEQNRLETIRTRNGLLPRLDVFIALGKTGYADTFTASFRNLDGPTYDFTAGVDVSQSLGSLVARGEHVAAVATRQQAAAAVSNLEQLVELDVLLAVNEVERARQQIAASATTRRLQERTVQAETERFDVGASTTIIVAQAQRDLLQAEINEVAAVISYRIALINLYLAEGSLLERRGVRVDI